MSAAPPPNAFIGRLIRRRGAPGVQDAFDSEAPWTPVRLDESDVPEGSIVEVLLRPDAGSEARGAEPARLLARTGTARAAIYEIAIEHGLDPRFPPEVVDEVSALLRSPGIADPTLVDLTHLPFVTVDDATTRDLDQALFVESAARDGGLVLWYALADASFYAAPGSALFAEALRRGASYYLPGLVVPMLPRALSEGLVSLNEGQLRRALVLRIGVDEQGSPTGTGLLRARIRSRAKLSFERVQAFFDAPAAQPMADPAVGESLELFRRLGERRLRHAEARHVVHYRRSEVTVRLGDGRDVGFVAEGEPRGAVERYNEQVSLLCNIEGARLLTRGDRPGEGVEPIYRVHPRPDDRRIAEFEALTAEVAEVHRLPATRWRWRRNGQQPLAAYLRTLPAAGPQGRIAKALHRQAVLLNVRSSFAAEAAEHYGVGAEVYARFSSPMREVVGIFVHKEALESTEAPPRRDPPGAPAPPPPSTDEQLRREVIDRANRAKETQKRITRAANRLVIDQWFAEDLRGDLRRPIHRGTILGLTRTKVHVLLDPVPLEVKVYVRDLERQRSTQLELCRAGAALRDPASGAVVCRLGDAVRIGATGRDRRRDRWELALEVDP